MQDKLTKIFKQAKYEVDDTLASNVWLAVVAHDKHVAKIKFWAFTSLGLASLAGLIPAFKILSTDLGQSGFYEYFSLIFSDGGSIVSFWKELVFSIAESLPVMSIVLSLCLMFVFFLSIKYATKQIINNNRLVPRFN
jgi:hypothetical protein